MKVSIVYLEVTGIVGLLEIVKGEKFYLCTAIMDSKVIKIRCPEHQLPNKGLYKLSCFLGSVCIKGKVYTFLDALDLEEVQQIPDNYKNYIYISGVVAGNHKKELIAQYASVELKTDVIFMSGNKYVRRRRNVIKATLIGNDARKIAKVSDGDILEGYGTLVVSKAGNLYVVLLEVTKFIRKENQIQV